MTLNEFKQHAKPGYIVPVFRKLSADFITPVIAYIKLRRNSSTSFLLESVIKGEQVGRYSFIGQNPYRVLIASSEKTIIQESDSKRVADVNFFDSLKTELDRYQNVSLENLPQFTCGPVGFIGYEMIRLIEKLPLPKQDTTGCDDAVMAFYDTLVAFDHLKNEVLLIANSFIDEESDLDELYNQANVRLDELNTILDDPVKPELHFKAEAADTASNFTEEHYKEAVDIAKEHIFAGDIFQVVLSQKFSLKFEGDPFLVYRALRSVNPSPYMFYLDFSDYQIVGSSPESVISVSNRELEIIPIAGTRPRGKSAAEDEQLGKGLLADPKETAEHIMLVDLARNDMGRVSEYGSVRVSDFKTIEKYSHVMHIISRVHGSLKKDQDAVDAFRAAFPAGTVSGAPKIRAMEIIHELEPDKRGFYAGAIGYFDYSGNMDMAIAIRTLLAKDNTLYYQAGAGIVADSQPELEFEETLNKGKALRKSIELASGGINDFVHR